MSTGVRPIRRLALALTPLALFVSACLGGTSPAPTDSGIQGRVTLGPLCPAMREGVPCPDRPYEATLAVVTPAGRRVATVTAGADGRYRVALAPGGYMLVPQSPPGKPLPRAEPLAVTVPAHAFVTVDIAYDSGIR